jgi:serine/threonine protein kinase
MADSYDTLAATDTFMYNLQPLVDYAEILGSFNLHYKHIEYYWQVGDPSSSCGWVLHLSVIKDQLSDLLWLVIPVLTDTNTPFRVIRNSATAESALEGHLGAVWLGKMICIYPTTPGNALALAKELISLTKGFKGPEIRTDRRLDGIVYTSLRSHMTIPFSLPPHTLWPFTEITLSQIPTKSKLLDYSYYPTSVIKGDAKGDVIKALYFEKPWKIRSCIIKQGRQNMFLDENGRDIQDRLKWQYELHSRLVEDIPLPKIFNHFSVNGDTYLAMQWINGISFTNYLNRVNRTRLWYDLPLALQLNHIDHLLHILNIVHRLHNRGYIHRDITPENFLLDKNNKIWLIDVELMWCAKYGQPTPPFGLGTPGFMSPEQRKGKTPTDKEDIYALGATIIMFLTNLAPAKFQQKSGDVLKQNLNFFIQNEMVASVISDCFEAKPNDRPTLVSIISALNLLRHEIQQPKKAEKFSSRGKLCKTLDHTRLRNTIQLTINSFAWPSGMDPDGHWLSRMHIESKEIGNEQLGMTVQEGWHTGVAGPLWLLALAHRLGYDIKNCMVAYEGNWAHIQKGYFMKQNCDKTLYAGGAGIALALAEGFDSGLLSTDTLHLQYLEQCFSKDISLPTLAEGIAGQGIGLLYASRWMNPKSVDDLLSSYVNSLMITQQKDGAWPLHITAGVTNYSNVYALRNGIAGIIWFLLNYLQKNPDPMVKTRVIKGLTWLIKKSRKKNKRYSWPHLNDTNPWSSENAAPGIVLIFIKAYQLFKMDIHRDIAQDILKSIPERPAIMDFTLSEGLSGIGEIYLEAYKVFNDSAWLNRAEWIAQILLHTLHIETKNEACWIPDSQSDFTADLFTGNSGIIHFLLHYSLPNSLTHPLNPFCNTN